MTLKQLQKEVFDINRTFIALNFMQLYVVNSLAWKKVVNMEEYKSSCIGPEYLRTHSDRKLSEKGHFLENCISANGSSNITFI